MSMQGLLQFVALGLLAFQSTGTPPPTTAPSRPQKAWRHSNEQCWLVSEVLGATAGLATYARTGRTADAAVTDLDVRQLDTSNTERVAFRVARRDGTGEAFELAIADHLFSPAAYAGVAGRWLGKTVPVAGQPANRRLPELLADLRMENLHRAHVEVSDALTRQPASAP